MLTQTESVELEWNTLQGLYESFDDVLIEPRMGIVDHRADIDIRTDIGATLLAAPIVSSPMDTVTNSRMAIAVERAGGVGVLHRFQTIAEQVRQYRVVKAALPNTQTYCAIGIEEGNERVLALANEGCGNFCLDVAHAHTLSVGRFLMTLPKVINLIVGSVATATAVRDLLDVYPVNAFRVGIGPGAACTTRLVTGAGVPQLTAIMNTAEEAHDKGVAIIADGGIRNGGDIVKAIVAGADAVMVGYLLAGADEAPQSGVYYGMASQAVSKNTPEGVIGKVGKTGPASDTIENLIGGIRSGISYAGGDSLRSIRGKTDLFIRVSPNSLEESRARI